MMNGPEGIRTLGLRVANAALSQLSYEPTGDDLLVSVNYCSPLAANMQEEILLS